MVTAASNLLAPVPKGLKHIKGALGGIPGEWLIPVNPKGALLYIHGGGFVAGHPPMYRPFCGALANALGFRVFMVDYRLAPENPFLLHSMIASQPLKHWWPTRPPANQFSWQAIPLAAI